MSGEVKGRTEPRIYTPPLRELTPETSLGYAAIEFATEVCGLTLYPWQEWLFIHALEIEGELGGRWRFRYRTTVTIVSRQQGKSTLSQVLSLFFMYVLGTGLVIGTAQDLDVAEEIWQGSVDLVEDVPELNALKERVVKVNGKKSLELTSGARYKVKAANRRAGRGLSGDLILLDELREHQTWDAWAAISHTAVARPNAQIWALSNAGDVTSVVLRRLRLAAHEALGDPDGTVAAAGNTAAMVDVDEADKADVEEALGSDDTLGLFEWSSPPDSIVGDIEALRWSNPSMGYGLVTVRSLMAAAKTDPEAVFKIECMCIWPDSALDGLFPADTWEAGQNKQLDGPDGPRVADADRIVSDVAIGLDMSSDRSRTWVARCGRRADGALQVEVYHADAGDAWVAGWLTERAGRIECVAGQGKGAPVSQLIENLDEDRAFRIPVLKWEGADLGAAFGQFYDMVVAGEIRHNPQPVLDQAVAYAEKRWLGERWVADRRKSPADVAPLTAAVAAVWAYTRPALAPPPPPPPPAALTAEEPDRGMLAAPLAGATGGSVMTMHF